LAIRGCPAFPQYLDGNYIIVTLKYANDEKQQNAVRQWSAKERKYSNGPQYMLFFKMEEDCRERWRL